MSPTSNSPSNRRVARAIVVRGDELLVNERWTPDGDHYFTFPGGGIESGETADQAALRELAEETSITATIRQLAYDYRNPRWGDQLFFVCDYVSGEPAVAPDAPEAAENALGRNRYLPRWIPLAEVPAVLLYPIPLQNRLLADARAWPAEPVALVD